MDYGAQMQGYHIIRHNIKKNAIIHEDVMHRIKIGYLKWRSVIGLVCNRKILDKLKVKFYRTMARRTMLLGSECWTSTSKAQYLHKCGS